MSRAHSLPASVICGLLLALAWAGGASAGPVEITWDSKAPATVAQPQPLADGQVAFGATPELLDTATDGKDELALVRQTPPLRGASLRGRGHLFLMRRPVDDTDARRPWERVGGQIDDMDPTHRGAANDTGVQAARLSCNSMRSRCWVAYTSQGRITLARLVEVGHGYRWERAQLDASIADQVGQLTVHAGYAVLAWTQADPASPTGSTVTLAAVRWPEGKPLEVRQALSFGPGSQPELAGQLLTVTDDREIRVYDTHDNLADRHANPALRLPRAQPTGRVLLSRIHDQYLVAEPTPGGTLVHQIAVQPQGYRRYVVVEWGSYRVDNPDWLPVGAAPVALTANQDQGWLLIGAPGAPGRHALVRITVGYNERLGARFYQIPNLPPPTGFDPHGTARVIPRMLGLINATIANGPPTVDLLTTAHVARGNDSSIDDLPIGQLMLLGERITLERASQ